MTTSYHIHPAFFDFWLIYVLSLWQWVVLCLHVAPLDPLPETWLSLTHARTHARTFHLVLFVHMPFFFNKIEIFFFLAKIDIIIDGQCFFRSFIVFFCFNVQHTETPLWNDNDDSQGDDQFSFLSNLAFCRQWQFLLSVSLSNVTRSVLFWFSQYYFAFSLSLMFFNIIYTLLIFRLFRFIEIHTTCRVLLLSIFMLLLFLSFHLTDSLIYIYIWSCSSYLIQV